MEHVDPESVSVELRRHLLEPLHVGESSGPGARTVIARNDVCGDVLELSGRFDATGGLELRFRARGCWAVSTVASLLCERGAGASAAEARALRAVDLVERAGGLPRSRAHAAKLADRALADLLHALLPGEGAPG
ncbi:MAG: iron-sulfur cluster assembly scaffold protein [Planctomycetota bacterium]